MKQVIRKSFILLLLCIPICISIYAVAPLPGLDLTEPIRKPIPQGIVHQQRAAHIAMEWQAPELVSRGLLIVVEFADTPLSAGNTVQSFDSLANADDYTYNGAMGSCKKYYQDQSNGKYTPQFDVVGPVILPKNTAYYGADAAYEGDDQYIADFVIDACKGAQAMGVDFSNYDQDNDGNVDLVYIIYAGYSQADGGAATCIWPHAWDMQSALYYGNTNQSEYYVQYNAAGTITAQNLPVLNGKTILRYACSNELIFNSSARTSIGTICHEFGHVLGLADLYITETSATGDPKLIPGSWALMSHGNYLNNGNTPPNLSVWEKYVLGWVEPEILYANEQHVVLPADGMTYRKLNRTCIHSEDGPLTTDTTYYLENRQMTGWDTFLPGHGMLVWRVVYDAEEWYYNRPNNTTTRFQLITANGSTPYTSSLKGGTRQDVPFPGKLEYTEYAPYAHTQLTNIQEVDGVISFDFTNSTYTNIESPKADLDINANVWYNLLGQPVDIHSYKGVAISKGKKIIIR